MYIAGKMGGGNSIVSGDLANDLWFPIVNAAPDRSPLHPTPVLVSPHRNHRGSKKLSSSINQEDLNQPISQILLTQRNSLFG